MADEIWEEVKAQDVVSAQRAYEEGIQLERARCSKIVDSEIVAGQQAGVPVNSAVMRILSRVLSAIKNG